MRRKGIDDVENHTQEDDSHAEADGNDKYGIQFSDKRYGRHTCLLYTSNRKNIRCGKQSVFFVHNKSHTICLLESDRLCGEKSSKLKKIGRAHV